MGKAHGLRGWPGNYDLLVGIYAQARDLAGDRRLPAALRTQVCIMTLELARVLGRDQEAVQAAHAAVEAAERWGDWGEVGMARLEAGRTLAEARMDEPAVAVLQRFLDDLNRYPWLEGERGPVQYQVGLVLHRRRHYLAALRAFRLAIRALGGHPPLLLSAYHHCCWLALRLDRLREAARYLAEAAPLALEDGEGAVVQEALQALHALRTGNGRTAERLAAAAAEAARKRGSLRALALATFVQAEVAQYRRRPRVHRELRQQAAAYLEASGCPELGAWLGAVTPFSVPPGPDGATGDGEECLDDPGAWSG